MVKRGCSLLLSPLLCNFAIIRHSVYLLELKDGFRSGTEPLCAGDKPVGKWQEDSDLWPWVPYSGVFQPTARSLFVSPELPQQYNRVRNRGFENR
jgi:hypothetical protein